MKKKIILLIILAASVITLCLFLRNTSFINETLFEKEKLKYQPYFKDDFNTYSRNSEILDSDSEDLSHWDETGVITAWTYIDNWEEISQIDFELKDSSGKKVILNGIENIKSLRENNKIKSNDEFADYLFNCNQSLRGWEDFMIVNDRNFLFWEYNESLGIDMSNIISWKALNRQNEIEIFDVVIHDGVCKSKNSLNGEWYAPNGLPQYGVWWTKKSQLIMKNVPQKQYPSNGDHARMLSEKGTPENFILKTRFEIVDLGNKRLRYIPDWIKFIFNISTEDPLQNTFIRFAWDFDNEYDPGHDESLVYYSFEYGYFGLQRVYPIERYFVQGYEPRQSNQKAKTSISLKEGHTYEVELNVRGQNVVAEIYGVNRFYWRKLGEIEYTFDTQRPLKEYPFSLETTGDVEISVDWIEVWKQKE